VHRDAARLCDFDADAGHLDIASSAAFAGAYRTVSPRSSGVDRLPASRELGFESSDILEKALSDQLEKVKTELWILEEKLLDLANEAPPGAFEFKVCGTGRRLRCPA